MRKFKHYALHSNVRTIEFLKVLQETTGVMISSYGYTSTLNQWVNPFIIIFEADQQAELFLRLKYGEDMYFPI